VSASVSRAATLTIVLVSYLMIALHICIVITALPEIKNRGRVGDSVGRSG
jgi:hypothetical protein